MKYLVLLSILLTTPSIFARPFKIAVIDSGMEKEYLRDIPLCDFGGYDYIENSAFVNRDEIGHGTNVTLTINAQIKQQKSEYCFMLYRVFSKNKATNTALAMAQAVIDGADIINMSFTGTEYSKEEEEVVTMALNFKVKFVAAVGNEGKNLDLECSVYPACIKSKLKNGWDFIVVGSNASTSNFGIIVGVVEEHCSNQPPRKMCGTSMSTAYTTGKIVNTWISERDKQRNVCSIMDNQ